jgi:carbonic anhydrase
MTDLETLYARNRQFASGFRSSAEPGSTGPSIVLVTCVDPRICPEHYLQLAPGEAFVIRKPGGRVTADVERDLAVLAALTKERSGEQAALFELVIVQHTDCAMEALADPARRQLLCGRTGLGEDHLMDLAISDHAESIRADVERLRRSAAVPGELVVSGHIYDIDTGALSQLVAPAPLAAPGPG